MRAWLLTFHLVGVVLWVGGLLGLARLLGAHAVEPPSARPSLSKIEARLDYLLAVPGALIAIGGGAAIVRAHGLHWFSVSLWLHLKLALVLILVVAHFGASAARRRIARLDPAQALSRGGWRALQALVVLLLIGIIALSLHQPLVGGG